MTRTNTDSDKHKRAESNGKSGVDGSGRMAAMAGAFAGASLLFISAILGQQSVLDMRLRVALYCFAGTLPIAALALVVAYNKLDSAWFSVPFWISAGGTFVGVAAILWYIDVKVAALFLIISFISMLYYFAFLT